MVSCPFSVLFVRDSRGLWLSEPGLSPGLQCGPGRRLVTGALASAQAGQVAGPGPGGDWTQPETT
eukprot:830968-Rhodomonas_salina.1